jgi:hypothetical protein
MSYSASGHRKGGIGQTVPLEFDFRERGANLFQIVHRKLDLNRTKVLLKPAPRRGNVIASTSSE